MIAMGELPFKLAVRTLVKYQLNKTGGIAISDCNVILVFSLQNQKQKSFLRAVASVRLFYDFPSKSVYLEKKM
jgi:hypothetical protein